MQANGTLLMRILESGLNNSNNSVYPLWTYFTDQKKNKDHRLEDRIRRLIVLFSDINEKSNADILKTRYKW